MAFYSFYFFLFYLDLTKQHEFYRKQMKGNTANGKGEENKYKLKERESTWYLAITCVCFPVGRKLDEQSVF